MSSEAGSAVWKERFRAPQIHLTMVADAAPDRGVVATNRSGVYQLYAWEVSTGRLTQLTDRPHGTVAGSISPDGRYVYYHDDRGGNEIGHYVRVPFEGGSPEDVTPDLPPYSSFSFSIDASNRRLGMMAAGEAGFQLCASDIDATGTLSASREVARYENLMFGPALAYGGDLGVLMSTERSGRPEFSLVAVDMVTGERVAELWDGPNTSLEMTGFSPLPGDTRLLGATNRTGIETVLIWNPRTGERVDLTFEGLEGALRGFDWTDDGNRILLRAFHRAVQQLYVYDLQTESLTKLDHPAGTIEQLRFMPGNEIMLNLQDSTHPAHVVALDAETGHQKREILAAGDVPPGHPWRSVTFTSADGTQIQGWVAVPDGPGPFPTILETHGGPEAVMSQVFSAGSQAWLDHGFAFMTINYRGSTTFGSDFQKKIWGAPGHWEVEDMTAARQWLIDEGIARPHEIFLTGWSYGGYLTLQALGTTPDLWAGGMAGIAIADWRIQYEDSAETLKAYQVAFFGGTPDEKPKQYAASSPITYVDRVQAPILIIQGRNDTRTPARPVEEYARRMRDLSKDITVHWFEAGHLGAFARIEQSIEHQELMLEFARRVLSQ